MHPEPPDDRRLQLIAAATGLYPELGNLCRDEFTSDGDGSFVAFAFSCRISRAEISFCQI